MKVELSKSQCGNLATFIECNLLDDIRKDPEIDNVEYVRDLLDAQKILEEAAKSGKAD